MQSRVEGGTLCDLLFVNQRLVEPRGSAAGQNLFRERKRRRILASNRGCKVRHRDGGQRRFRAVGDIEFIALARRLLRGHARNFLRRFFYRPEIFLYPAVEFGLLEIADHNQCRVIRPVKSGVKRPHFGQFRSVEFRDVADARAVCRDERRTIFSSRSR